MEPTPWSPDGLPDVTLYVGPAASYRGNIHEDWKLVTTTAGYEIERRDRRCTAGPGELIALHPGEANSGTARAPGQWRIICLPAALISRVSDPGLLRFDPPVLARPGLADQFHAVFALFQQPVGTTERYEALLELAAALVPLATAPSSRPGPADLAALETAHAHLAAHRARQVPLDELAALTGVQKYRLVRLCTHHYGVPPHALHLRLRLDHARALIRRGEPLSDTALATGFYDHAHFTRTFQRAYRMTPSQYRDSWHSPDAGRRKLALRPDGGVPSP